ncbi:unnamed protein product [Durusdinium trenchii]|uniref:Solute carrier family 40 protein n=1 Tax=Durusdinium trenchii TaxID=1381693 RepID=A0ABP0HB31_9DINO
MGPASQRGIWLPNLRRPDVSARHMANLLDAKARNALSACRGLRVLGSSWVFLLSLALLNRCLLGMSIKAVVEMLRAHRDGNVVAFLIGALSTVLLQSSSQSLDIAGEMVSDQVEVQSGILFAIGTSVGASGLPVLVAMMPGCRLHLTRAVWGIASFQFLKLMTLAASGLLLVPAEILSRGQLLGFTSQMVQSMASINFHYVNPATWVVQPLSNLLVRINDWRLKAYILGPPAQHILEAGAAGCPRDGGCAYSCLSNRLHDVWRAVDATFYDLQQCDVLNTAANNTHYSCSEEHPWCIRSGETFWRQVVEQGIIEVGGVLCGLITGTVFLYAACQFLLRDLAHSSAGGRVSRCYVLLEKAIAVPDVLACFGIIVFTLLLMHDSVFVACILTPLAGVGMLPASKMMCWVMAAQVGESLAMIAKGATQQPFSRGVVQLAWVQLFCSILAILITALPFMRRLACHCSLICATACHEFLVFVSIAVVGIPAILAGIFALTVLWDSSPSFTVCIMLVVLPLVISAIVWICLRSDWLLPVEVREEVREECQTQTPMASPAGPTFLSSFSPHVRSPPSGRTLPAKSPSPSPAPTSPLSPMPNLEMIAEDREDPIGNERNERTIGPKITAPLPVMPVVPRSSRPSGGSDDTYSSADAGIVTMAADWTPDITSRLGRAGMTPVRADSDESNAEPTQLSEATGANLEPEHVEPEAQGFWPGLWRQERHAISASPEDRDRPCTGPGIGSNQPGSWGSSLQVLTSRLRVSSTPISVCGSEESC